jgi:hypothetical protein
MAGKFEAAAFSSLLATSATNSGVVGVWMNAPL